MGILSVVSIKIARFNPPNLSLFPRHADNALVDRRPIVLVKLSKSSTDFYAEEYETPVKPFLINICQEALGLTMFV